MHEKLDGPGKEAMLNEILGRIDARIKSLTERAAKLRQAGSITELFAAHIASVKMGVNAALGDDTLLFEPVRETYLRSKNWVAISAVLFGLPLPQWLSRVPNR